MASCKRLLIAGPQKAGKLSFLKALTDSLPDSIPSGSHGGLTHQMDIDNRYYKVAVDIWVDEYEGAGEFADLYTSDEALEVRNSLGAIVLCLPDTSGCEESLEHIKRVADQCGEDLLRLIVFRKSPAETKERLEVEDACLNHGFELINMDATGKNEYGELQGIARAKEVIQTADWSELLDEADEHDIEAMLKEDSELNQALLNQDLTDSNLNVDEASVEELEALMQRILLAREHSSDLSQGEKKAMAAKLVAEVMRNSK